MEPFGLVVGRRRRPRFAGAAVTTALALGAGLRALIELTSPAVQQTSPSQTVGRLTVDAVVALTVAAAAWVASATSARAASGLALIVAGWLVPSMATGGPGTVDLALLAADPLMIAGAVVVVLAWSDDPGVGTRRAMRLALVMAALAATVHLLGYNPFADPGCRATCADVPPLLEPWLSTRASSAITSLLAIGAGAVALARLPRARAPHVVVVASAIGLATLMVHAATPLVGWASQARGLADPALPSLAALVVGLAVLIAGVSAWRIRMAVERLASGLVAPEAVLSAAGGVRTVAYAIPDQDRWVDASGGRASEPHSTSSCFHLFDASGPAVRLELIPRRGDSGAMRAGLTSATGLALSNARLAAVGRARMAEVQASQRRIVSTVDSERLRIERDLHDGVQQRLVSVAFHLRVAMTQAAPDLDQSLVLAEGKVREALAQLRRLAHGVFPTALAEEGLDVALEDLAAGSDVLATLDVQVEAVLAADTSMAAYAVVATVLASVEPPAAVTVRVRNRADVLSLRLQISQSPIGGLPGLLADVEDRVGALGGTLTVAPRGDVATDVTVVIPCA